MKNSLAIIALVLISSISWGYVANAATVFIVPQGGTGVNTIPTSQLVYGAGTAAVKTVATTTASCSGSVTCTSFTVIGASPITISASAGSSGLATTSPWTVGQVAYVVSNAAVTSVATSTLNVGTSLTVASGALGYQIGGSNVTINTIQDIRTTASPSFTGLTISDLHNALLGTDASGAVVATTSVGVNYLTGVLPIANGGTNNNTYTTGSIPYFDGTKLNQDNSNLFWDSTNHRFGVGTTTPSYPITLFSSSQSQFSLSSGTGIAQWAFRNAGGNLYISTTTIAGTSTTTPAAVEIQDTGTTTLRNTNGFDFNGSGGSHGMRIIPGATTTLEFY